MSHFLNASASLNLLSRVKQSNNAKTYLPCLPMKQWPAFSVVPVFTPYHPFHNNLLVFFHCHFLPIPNLSFIIDSSNVLVFITLENVSFLQATVANRAIC